MTSARKAITDILIDMNSTIKEAFKKLDRTATKVLFVIGEKNVLIGALSDGDIRRALLAGNSLDDTIKQIYNRDPITVSTQESNDKKLVGDLMIENRIGVIPIVDSMNRITNFLEWAEVFSGHEIQKVEKRRIDIPVVIMAGGKGTRMEPFTSVLPKPLIPIGDQTILELIISQFQEYNVKKVILTLNYKAEMIKAYLDGFDKDYEVEYITEKEFLGTAGSLSLASEHLDSDFIVSNCDIILQAPYDEVYRFHKEQESWLTILSSIQHYTFPYGVVEFSKGGRVTNVREKPEFSFPINSGVYILEKRCLEVIPKSKVYDMTDLIADLIKHRRKVITYPVNEHNFVDIGQWDEYRKNIRILDNRYYHR
jgi:dTDP-glucose pyrophosphorylase